MCFIVIVLSFPNVGQRTSCVGAEVIGNDDFSNMQWVLEFTDRQRAK